MLNNYQVNQGPLNTNPLPITATQDDVAFDGYGLQNAYVITTKADYDDSRWMDLNQFARPNDDGGGTVSRYYRGRDISLEITIKGDTAQDLNDRIDDFKRNLRNVEGNLDIKVGWETRRIRATLTSVVFDRRHYNLTFIQAKAVFRTTDPFWQAKDAQSFQFLGKTATFSEEFTNAGSVESDPKIYLIFGGASNVSTVSVTAFGRTLSFYPSAVANDIVIIDADEKTVVKNGMEIDYTGQFPKMRTGSCPFTVTFTGTVSCDCTVVVAKNYV